MDVPVLIMWSGWQVRLLSTPLHCVLGTQRASAASFSFFQAFDVACLEFAVWLADYPRSAHVEPQSRP